MNERFKRDASASSSDSDSSSSSSSDSDDSEASDVSSAIDDECDLLGDYIDDELLMEPLLPDTLLAFAFGPSAFFVSVLDERVPRFLALLASTPTILGGVSQTIADAAAQLPGVGFQILAELFADVVAVADDTCGIALNQEQTTQLDRLFDDALTVFLVVMRDCSFLSASLVEEAVAAAEFSAEDPNDLVEQLQLAAGGNLIFTVNRTVFNIEQVLELPSDATDDDIESAAETALSEFLFFVNDFCGFPTLSGTTLELLETYYLDDLVAEATGGV